jgi:hypothetical protein
MHVLATNATKIFNLSHSCKQRTLSYIPPRSPSVTPFVQGMGFSYSQNCYLWSDVTNLGTWLYVRLIVRLNIPLPRYMNRNLCWPGSFKKEPWILSGEHNSNAKLWILNEGIWVQRHTDVCCTLLSDIWVREFDVTCVILRTQANEHWQKPVWTTSF